ncbi:hypothetical protein [Lactococcus garvieae]|uniref:Uncharacterized protein n=1 Tax=Lactococcus garvieae TaxID=1363 RepID=A0AA46TVQ6_9LACT|nr:hypothetical protein [Lactococcus garvieae]UYT10390.1 hypothetical protein OF801_00180 [Lactococcus garvieae]UYT12431.1 hypothetical protein OF800_00185 [Lactococcus garvieae]
MIKKAYSLMIISIICVILAFSTFFFNFKYDPGLVPKLAFIWAFTFLGVQSYLWMKKLKNKSNKKQRD